MTERDTIWNELTGAGIFTPEKYQTWLAEKTGVDAASLAVDRQGNLSWSNAGKGKKLMVLFRIQPLGVVVKGVQKEYCDLMPLPGTDGSKITDTACVSPAGTAGIIRGIGGKAEDLRLKVLGDMKVGDCFYIAPNCSCKGELLYGCQVGSLAIASCAISCIKAYKDSETAVTVAIVNESASGIEKSLQMIARTKPDGLLVCNGVAGGKGLDLSKGPGLVIKDGTWVIDREAQQKLQEAASGNGIDIQPFVGDTGNALAQIYLSAKTKALAGIYLPVEELGSRIEEMNLKDVEKTQNLLLKSVESFAIIERDVV